MSVYNQRFEFSILISANCNERGLSRLTPRRRRMYNPVYDQPRLDYGGLSAFNVLQLNESAGTAPPPFYVQQSSDTNKQPYYDPFDPDPRRRFKMVGNFQRDDNMIPPSTSDVPGFTAGSYGPWANFCECNHVLSHHLAVMLSPVYPVQVFDSYICWPQPAAAPCQ